MNNDKKLVDSAALLVACGIHITWMKYKIHTRQSCLFVSESNFRPVCHRYVFLPPRRVDSPSLHSLNHVRKPLKIPRAHVKFFFTWHFVPECLR